MNLIKHNQSINEKLLLICLWKQKKTSNNTTRSQRTPQSIALRQYKERTKTNKLKFQLNECEFLYFLCILDFVNFFLTAAVAAAIKSESELNWLLTLTESFVAATVEPAQHTFSLETVHPKSNSVEIGKWIIIYVTLRKPQLLINIHLKCLVCSLNRKSFNWRSSISK